MLKIINEDGVVLGTQIVDPETGHNFAGMCTGLTIEMAGVNSLVTATMTMALMRAEIAVGRAEWLAANPVTGEFAPVARIEFKDGTVMELGEDGTPLVKPGVVAVNVLGTENTIKVRGETAD